VAGRVGRIKPTSAVHISIPNHGLKRAFDAKNSIFILKHPNFKSRNQNRQPHPAPSEAVADKKWLEIDLHQY
jgi:hypothetical protein